MKYKDSVDGFLLSLDWFNTLCPIAFASRFFENSRCFVLWGVRDRTFKAVHSTPEYKSLL